MIFVSQRWKVAKEHLSVDCVPDRHGEQKARRDEATIRQEYDKICTRLSELLPVEQSAQVDLQNKLKDLQAELFIISHCSVKPTAIDMSFLSRRKWSAKDKCAVPQFAIFSTKNPTCVLKYGRYRTNVAPWTSEPAVFLQFCGQPIRDVLVNRANYEWGRRGDRLEVEVSLSTTFSGAMPDSTRQLILAAEKAFDNVFIVADAPEWQLQVQQVPLPVRIGDPLVIGQKGQKFWLLDKFLTTAAEDWALSEFTVDHG